jgi:hypothetical protein
LALVIGPNGVPTEVPDDMADCLVGNGKRGYSHAPEPEPEPKRTTRRTATK